jgi:hypothetical protein
VALLPNPFGECQPIGSVAGRVIVLHTDRSSSDPRGSTLEGTPPFIDLPSPFGMLSGTGTSGDGVCAVPCACP